VAAVLVVAAGSVVITIRQRDSDKAAAGPGTCTGAETLRVIAAPAIAPAITTIANRWQQTHPEVNDICVFTTVTSKSSLDAEQSLLGVSNATLWIPDSSVWSSRLATDAPDVGAMLTVGRSVAKSPLVVATAPARSAKVAAAAKQGLASTLSGSTPVTLPDPTVTTEGAVALLGLQAQFGTSADGSNELGTTFLHLAERVVPNAAAGFAALKDYPGTAPAFVASEQQVITANEGRRTPVAKAVYPSGTSAALDFPLVAITPSRVNIYADALKLFAKRLAEPDAVHALNAINLRDTNATPFKGDSPTPGVQTKMSKLAPPATATTLTGVLRRWVSARAPNQFLMVIDVSGSMRDDSGDRRSKITVAAEAAAAAVTLMPDSWSVGLWTFSVRPSPQNDWSQLVPLGAVANNRSALLDAAHSLPTLTNGDTGLYKTALAAYQSVTGHYAANKVNSVVLMTDGANTDTNGVDLPGLIAALKAARDPNRPVSITGIALGKDADVGALRQISDATGGRTYVVRSAKDIRTAFVRVTLRGA
jgi:Ca-activated chloride channel homolog